MIPGLGLLRRIVFSVVILGGLFIAGNVWLEGLAESRVATAVQRSFRLEQEPQVEVRGFPIVVNALTGNLPGVTITASDVTVAGLEMRTLEVDLDGLQTEGGVLGGNELTIAVDEGRATAIIDQDAINAFLEEKEAAATVELSEGRATVTARRRIAGRRRTIVATGVLKIDVTKADNRWLVFDPRKVTIDGEDAPKRFEDEAKKQARVSVRLPELPGGIKIDEASALDGAVRLVARLGGHTVQFGGEGARIRRSPTPSE